MLHSGFKLKTALDFNQHSPVYTIVVAANNSPASMKNVAKYICDGVDDQVQINDALTDIYNVGGGKVILTDGQFEAKTAIYGKAKVSLEGSGLSTILNIDATTPNNWAIKAYVGDTYFSVRNLKIIANSNISTIHLESEFSQIEDVYSDGGIGLVLSGNNSVAQGNFVKNCSSAGISGTGADCLIENNHCETCDYGIDGVGDRCKIIGNITKECVQFGIHATGGVDISIEGNITFNNTKHGIYISGTPYKIIDNIVYLNKRNGILSYYGTNNIIAGNIVKDNSQEADNTYNEIELYANGNGNIIRNNNVRCTAPNKAQNGIKVGVGDYNIIVGNLVENTYTKINNAGVNDVVAHNQEI